MSEKLRYWHVDAFTNEVFSGNPATVTLLEREPSDLDWARKLADEFNLPMNTFSWKMTGETGAVFRTLFFTPTVEMPVSGHGILSTCHVLWESGTIGSDEKIILHTNAGEITAFRDNGLISIEMPIFNLSGEFKERGSLIRAFQNFPIVAAFTTVDTGQNADRLMVLENERDVCEYNPNFELIKEITDRGLILTAPALQREGYDFVSRYFAPNFGVDEDWVTGIAHSALIPYWSKRLGMKKLIGRQVSRRPGEVLGVVGDDRIILSGTVKTVMAGVLNLSHP